MNLEDLSKEIIKSRSLLRFNYVKSARIIELTIWYLSYESDEIDKVDLETKVNKVYRQIYTIDPLTLFILGIIINTIVKLIIEWWYHKKDVNELRSMQRECTSLKRLLASKGL